MEAAAKNLVPVTLELGGKSPAIVDSSANLDLAAKRIVWGKFLNAGQTCIAPDYVLVDSSIYDELVKKIKAVLKQFYNNSAVDSNDYGKIVNERQFDRLASIIEQEQDHILYGGHYQKDSLFIEPTLIEASSWENSAMQDELFGPLLPIMSYDIISDAIQMVREHPKPLSLYIFTEDKNIEKQVLSQISFGGGCVNDTISHTANHHMPFGGVGHSGMGAYHGKYSFELFTHSKSILKKSTRFDIGIIFPPYGNKLNLIRKLLK